MSNPFFEFKDKQLRLMPLDTNKKYTRDTWIKKNQEKSKWNYVSVSGVEFEELIGKGANGIVLKAVESVSQRKCAVKFWTPHKKSYYYDVNFERYQEEIKKVANLQDSAIVTIYTADKTSNGYYYSTMEWIEGITLKEFLNKKHFKDTARYPILETILRTIVKCHQLDVFHGDLHSENILILNSNLYGYNYEVKILDFGTSLLNRLNKPAYGKQRESALLLETSLKLLHEEDKYELLNYKFYSSKNASQIKIIDVNDVRNYHPILVSTTLKNLNKIYSILETNPINDFVISDVLDLLVTSTGIDLKKFIMYLLSKLDVENENSYEIFFSKLSYKLDDQLFYTSDYHDHNKRDVELILCYYDLLKKVDSDSKFNDDWSYGNHSEQTFDYGNILHLESLKEVEEWIFDAKKFLNEKQFIAFRGELFNFLGNKYTEEYQLENKLLQAYDLVTKLNELRLTSKEMSEIIECMTEY